jgi:transposase-like protein
MPGRERAARAGVPLAKRFAATFLKAVAKTTDDEDELLAFHDSPAGRWMHLRTTNPVESAFATVRLPIEVTKDTERGTATMAIKLAKAVRNRWRAANASHLVALFLAGAPFERGHLSEPAPVVA